MWPKTSHVPSLYMAPTWFLTLHLLLLSRCKECPEVRIFGLIPPTTEIQSEFQRFSTILFFVLWASSDWTNCQGIIDLKNPRFLLVSRDKRMCILSPLIRSRKIFLLIHLNIFLVVLHKIFFLWFWLEECVSRQPSNGNVLEMSDVMKWRRENLNTLKIHNNHLQHKDY